MLWIHGGSYKLGTGATYNGTALASKGVVVVTINYRLEVFGKQLHVVVVVVVVLLYNICKHFVCHDCYIVLAYVMAHCQMMTFVYAPSIMYN